LIRRISISAGLAKNIGSGLQGFFYEPAAGLMKSPEGFVMGIGTCDLEKL
jgi:hypothetical protein